MFDRRHRVILLFQTWIGKLSVQTSACIFFFDQYRGIIFFCRVWLMFCMPSKRKHAGVGRNTTSVKLERKNLANLHCKFLRQHRTKKTSSTIKNYRLPFVKKIAQFRLKNISYGFTMIDVDNIIFYSIPE